MFAAEVNRIGWIPSTGQEIVRRRHHERLQDQNCRVCSALCAPDTDPQPRLSGEVPIPASWGNHASRAGANLCVVVELWPRPAWMVSSLPWHHSSPRFLPEPSYRVSQPPPVRTGMALMSEDIIVLSSCLNFVGTGSQSRSGIEDSGQNIENSQRGRTGIMKPSLLHSFLPESGLFESVAGI